MRLARADEAHRTRGRGRRGGRRRRCAPRSGAAGRRRSGSSLRKPATRAPASGLRLVAQEALASFALHDRAAWSGSRPRPAAGSGSCSSSSARSPRRRCARPAGGSPAPRRGSARRCAAGGRAPGAESPASSSSTAARFTAARCATSRLLRLPVRELVAIAPFEVGERRAPGGELADELVGALEGSQGCVLEGPRRLLGVVDLGQEGAVLALVPDPVDLLLEVLQLSWASAIAPSALRRSSAASSESAASLSIAAVSTGELVVERAHLVGNSGEKRVVGGELPHRFGETDELLQGVSHGLCSGSTWIRTRDLPVMSRLL